MLKNKKFLMFTLLAALSVFVLAACGGDKKESSDKESTGSASALETIKANDKIVWGVKNDTKLFGLKNPALVKLKVLT